MLSTSEVRIVGYGTWEADDGRAFTYRDGTPVEFVEFVSDDEPRSRRVTLDRSVNGARPAVGEVVSLLINDYLKADAAINREGKAFPVYREKRKVVGFNPMPPVSSAS